jgi:hypothetical protein
VFDLERYAPEEPECFGLLVQAMIGPENLVGEESFDFVVCSPQWLATHMPADGYLFGRHYLLLARYDYATMRRAIQKVCDQAQGPTWDVVGALISRYGRWEFEDYSP